MAKPRSEPYVSPSMTDVSGPTPPLTDRYTIEREIGRGGSATVYLARDEKHHRRVALKVLDPQLGTALGADRSVGEIRVTANLQHPNILPLFDSGEAASLYVPIRAYMADGAVLTPEGVVEMGAAIAAAAASQWDVAESHFQGALVTAERVPHVLAQIEVRRWHAWMLRRRRGPGDAERAEILLREALDVAERARLPRRIRLCRAALVNSRSG